MENGHSSVIVTEILRVDPASIKRIPHPSKPDSLVDDWSLELPEGSIDARHLQRAADELRRGDLPVAFPTETVYGLGADATRSDAVKGIYKAKQRPSDNPLIVHVHSLNQLRQLLLPKHGSGSPASDPIPAIYLPLIERFWPGPLTLLMPNPSPSHLAPEVTAGLPTFGARMPSNDLALAVLKLADRPLAAPSANASTKPSPTAAEHVKHDLDGRIATIIDGGSCDVGVESTVVDGLCDPPCILRPGGITLDHLRSCPGWERVQVAYKDKAQAETAPRAPGMKYKHYSPKAPVVLYEHASIPPTVDDVSRLLTSTRSIGIIRTHHWPPAAGLSSATAHLKQTAATVGASLEGTAATSAADAPVKLTEYDCALPGHAEPAKILDISIGPTPSSAARGLFSGLRMLDAHNVDVILVEGIDDAQADVAAAVMNRIRKAAEVKVAAAS